MKCPHCETTYEQILECKNCQQEINDGDEAYEHKDGIFCEAKCVAEYLADCIDADQEVIEQYGRTKITKIGKRLAKEDENKEE